MQQISRIVFCLLALGISGGVLPADEPKKMGPTPEEALQRLRDGNKRFVADQTGNRATYPDQRARLAARQQPFAIVLACADSRVAPELIFNQQLGALFTLRVAGNVTDPALLGSIEFAVANFQVPLVVVVGHSNCGAVRAALDGGRPEGNLGELVKRVHVGKDLPKDQNAALAAGIQANVIYHAGQLTKQSKIVKDFVTAGRVKIVAGVYSLESGEVNWLELPKQDPGKIKAPDGKPKDVVPSSEGQVPLEYRELYKQFTERTAPKTKNK
jgi:carbonic anhydrase